uniref:Uncharacterized protein n=1 Tax=Magallana gigas TaxID=29159 RepID=A0A8W8HQJ0_MAGGI
MRLMRYEYDICHVPGKSLYTADALSRSPQREIAREDEELQKAVEAYVDSIIETLPARMCGLRSLRMGAIHPDLAILETHFGGRVPLNLEKACKEFQNILKEKKFGIKMDPKKDPAGRDLEYKYRIKLTSSCN